MKHWPLILQFAGMVGVVALIGCSSPTAPCSTMSPQRGAVGVSFHDPIGDSIVYQGVRGEIREGSYRDSLRAGQVDSRLFEAGRGRPGTYTVTATVDGFLPVERSGIRASTGVCGNEIAIVPFVLERVK